RAQELGLVRLDPDRRIVDLVEKPRAEAQLEALRVPADRPGAEGREYLANMGIYLFRRQVLFDLLRSPPPANDLVIDLIARNLDRYRTQAHLFDGYWEDLGTIRSYYRANLALAGEDPPFDFQRPEGVIYTHMRDLPATRVSGARIEQGLV